MDQLPPPSALHIMFGQPNKNKETEAEQKISDYAEETNRRWADHKAAPRTPTLPAKVALPELPQSTDQTVTLGIKQVDLSYQTWNTRTDPFLVCLGSPKSGKTTALATICRQLAHQQRINTPELKPYVLILSRKNTLLEIVDPGENTAWTNNIEEANEALHHLTRLLPETPATKGRSQAEIAESLLQRTEQARREFFVIIDDLESADTLDFGLLTPHLPFAETTGLRIAFTHTPRQGGYGPFTNFINAFKTLPTSTLLLSTDPALIDIWAKQRGCYRDPGRAMLLQTDQHPTLIHIAAHDKDLATAAEPSG